MQARIKELWHDNRDVIRKEDKKNKVEDKTQEEKLGNKRPVCDKKSNHLLRFSGSGEEDVYQIFPETLKARE